MNLNDLLMNADSNITTDMKSDFCIKIDFQKGTESPSRVFRTMTELIEAFEEIDLGLVESIHAKIEPVVIIEDIEAGSIKAWLAYKLRSTDDEILKQFDWKPVVGKYLTKAKYIVLNFLEDKTEITDRNEIEELEKKLLRSAEETDLTQIPSYIPIQRPKLLSGIERITTALSHLSENDEATYISAENESKMNASFNFIPAKIEELMTEETIKSKSEMILKVKKPDYLGESQWDFRHETHPIPAKILDEKWLKDFQSRKHDVRPGDSLRAIVETEVNYDYNQEVVGTYYYIIEIKEVIRQGSQNELDLPQPEK